MGLTTVQVLLCLGMLITGSINTLSKKAQNDCSSPGYPNATANNSATVHKFDHPWFQTVIMFLGEMICLFGLLYKRFKEKRQALEEAENRLMVSPSTSGSLGERALNVQHPRIFQWIFIIPTLCDLLGTSLSGIGLLYVDASVWQMLRGSIIVFTGIFSKIFFKRKLACLKWLGIFVTMIGLVLVGMSGVFKEQHQASSEASHVILGIILIVVSQMISAGQMILEEIFLKNKGYHPLQVVGMEGTFGFLIMAVIVLPAMYFIPGKQIGGSYENSLDALYQIGKDYRLLIFTLLYLSSIAFYNYFGLAVTRSLTAVHRTLIDACRTIMVWLVSLVVYYGIDHRFGEKFDETYGLLQVDGFIFLMIGTACYNELIEIPCIPCLRNEPPETYPSLVETEPAPTECSIQADDENSPLLKAAHE